MSVVWTGHEGSDNTTGGRMAVTVCVLLGVLLGACVGICYAACCAAGEADDVAEETRRRQALIDRPRERA